MAGPWEKYAKPESAESGPWSKYQAPIQEEEEPGIGQQILEGIGTAARAVDNYTGAPVRAGIGAFQDGAGISGGIVKGAKQFGQQLGHDVFDAEAPEAAPTETDIRKKAGIDLGDEAIGKSKVGKFVGDQIAKDIISYTPTGWLAQKFLDHVSPNDMVDFGIGAAADITNAIPFAGAAKRGGKVAIEAADMALRKTGRAIEKTGEMAGRVGSKVLAGATGADEAAFAPYLRKHNELKDIVDVRSGMIPLKDDLDATLEPLQSRVGSAKESVAAAKERRAEELARLADSQREAKESLSLAEEQRMGETSARVSGDVQRLNKEVSSGSEKAFEILDREGVRVPVTPIKSDLTKGIKALEQTAITDEQIAVVDLLKRYRERLDKFGVDIPGGEAKRLIQSLDREMTHLAPGSVGRLAKDDQVLGIMRRRFDAPLKESEEYAKQMVGVAADTKLLRGAEGMATESGAARALQASRLPSGKDRADVLRLLGERQGQNYLAAVDRSTLPEYQRLKGILQRYRAARKGAELKQANAELQTAIGELAPFKSIAPNEFGKSGAESLIRNQLRPKTAGLDQAELVKSLDQKFGKNYSEKIEDLKTIAAFDKDFTRGSANTNFWAIALGAGGTLFGGVTGGVVGGAAGAALGRMVMDKFGPATARVILDQIPKLKRMAPADWVQSLRVPEKVKAQLLDDLAEQSKQVGRVTKIGNAVIKPTREAGAEIRRVAEDDNEPTKTARAPAAPAKGEEKWARTGLERLGLSESPEAMKILADPKGRMLLIQASELTPGSQPMQRIRDKIREGWGAK